MLGRLRERLHSLLKVGEDPLRCIDHPELGQLMWSEDDEAWFGDYGGLSFSLAYDFEAHPKENLARYAFETMNGRADLVQKVSAAKEDAVSVYSSFYRDEILELSLGTLHFYTDRQGLNRILADLEGGRDYRAWRVEFRDSVCEGIGFDS